MKRLSFFTKSIRNKFILVSVILTIAPLVTLGTISYHISSSSLDELGATNLKNGVEQTIELINTLNEDVEDGRLSLEEAQERVKVYILGEMDEDGIRPVNPNCDFGEAGYIFILYQKGTRVAHPEDEGTNIWEEEDHRRIKFAQEMIKTGTQGGFVYYDWPLPEDPDTLAPKIVYAKTDPNWGWVVSASTFMRDFNAPAKGIFNTIIVTSLVTMLIGGIIIYIFVKRITTPVKLVTDRIVQLSGKNLKPEPLKINRNDETGKLADAANALQNDIKKIMKEISRSSDTVAANSEELYQSANEMMGSTEQVSLTMQELASGSDSLSGSAKALSEEMDEFSKKIQEINEAGKYAGENSRNILQMTEESSWLMEMSEEQMDKINELVKDSVAKMQRLNQKSAEITKLVSIIHDIASQTNLLALNASIEAARAGEHGKGFAVVASEVGKLAEQVAGYTKGITENVNAIQEETKQLSASLQRGYEEVDKGKEQIGWTGRTFRDIKEEIKQTTEYIANISENLAEITKNTGQMNQAIDEVASISEEAATGIEEASAAVEETNSSMDEIVKSSEQLAKTAEKLNGLVREFKI